MLGKTTSSSKNYGAWTWPQYNLGVTHLASIKMSCYTSLKLTLAAGVGLHFALKATSKSQIPTFFSNMLVL